MTSGKRYKILIVDDEPLNIQFLETLISDQFDVIFDTSGEDALSIVKSGKPDLIVLDIMMPGMDGYEVCRRLKADPETQPIPVIFVTAKDGEEEETKGLDLGAVDYITKPFNPEIVKRKITNHIQQIAARPNRAPSTDGADRGRRASDKITTRSWIIAGGVLGALIIGGVISLQIGLIPWPASTSQAVAPVTGQTNAPATTSTTRAPTTAAPSAPAKASKTPTEIDRARRLASLEWLDETKCPEIPAVAWWRFVSHRSIARYVTRNLEGDWPGYLKKWTARLDNVQDILERDSTAVTDTGIKLSGDELTDYVANMKIRVAAIKCLQQAADDFAKSIK